MITFKMIHLGELKNNKMMKCFLRKDNKKIKMNVLLQTKCRLNAITSQGKR